MANNEATFDLYISSLLDEAGCRRAYAFTIESGTVKS